MTTIDWSDLPEWTNDAYKPLYADWNRFNVIYGGSGSGKSHYIVQRAVFRLLDVMGYNLLVVRKFGVTNRFSTFALFRQVVSQWGLSELFQFNKSDLTITCLPTGNQVLFLGMDDPEKVKSITFANGILSAIWCEEASELNEGDLMQLDLRLRGFAPVPFQITVSFNPISAYHWLKTYFFDTPQPSATILKTTYLDNRFIDAGYKARLDSLTGTARQVYALGDWGVTEGLVFKDFGQAQIPDGARLYGYGCDFGFSSDPAAVVAVWQRGEEIYLDEIIYQTGLTNTDLSNLMKSNGIRTIDKIVADSAEPKSIEDLFRAGWNVHPAKKGPDSIRFGLDFMMSKKLFITPTSRNLLKEFYSYTWRQDKNGKWLPEPVDAFNHGIDAARYLCMDINKGKLSVPTSNIRARARI